MLLIRSRRLPIVCLSVLALLSVAACSSGRKNDAATTTTTLADGKSNGAATGAAPAGSTPKASVVDAVKTLLQAEKDRDRATSFALLSADSRVEFKSIADWTARRDQLPTPLAFDVKAGKDAGTAIATISYTPSLDPFKGLVTTTEIETWTGVKVAGGWLLNGDQDIELVLPDQAKAVDATKAWAEAVEACDEAAGKKLEAVSILFGTSTEAAKLCGSKGAVTVGAPKALASGPASSDIVSQYTSDSLTWTRVVPVTAPVHFDVILAPIGGDWRVIGIADAS